MIAFCFGCLFFYLCVSVIGPVRLDRLSMAGVLALGTTLALPSWLRAWRLAPAAVIQWRDAGRAHPYAAMTWILVSLILLSLLIQGLAPPADYDSLNYHLGLPRRDLEQGFIGPNWPGLAFSFFPALSEHLYRLAMAIGGRDAAQPVTGLFGLFLAFGSALLTRRLGYGPLAAAMAALMAVSVRATVWELASCMVETQQAVYAILAMLAYLGWRRDRSVIWGVILGAALAGGILVKYMGLGIAIAFAALILADLLTRKLRLAHVLLAALVALALLIPHAIRDFYYTGNPIFPLFNSVFTDYRSDFFATSGENIGRSEGILNFLRVYWDISILPTYYFDGAQLGAPYFLAFAPLALVLGRIRPLMPLLTVTVIYTAVWYWGINQQIRFLIAVTPFLAVLSAIGLSRAWTHLTGWGRPLFLGAGLVLAMNQGLFVGIYAVLRLPAAMGLISPQTYHDKTPGLAWGFYSTCTFVDTHLAPGEKVLSFLAPPSVYCPQVPAILSPALPGEEKYWLSTAPLPPLTARQLGEAMLRNNVSMVIMETQREYRGGPESAPTLVISDYSGDRMGRHIQPLTKSLTPLSQDRFSAVYDGHALAHALIALPDTETLP